MTEGCWNGLGPKTFALFHRSKKCGEPRWEPCQIAWPHARDKSDVPPLGGLVKDDIGASVLGARQDLLG